MGIRQPHVTKNGFFGHENLTCNRGGNMKVSYIKSIGCLCIERSGKTMLREMSESEAENWIWFLSYSEI